MSVLAFATAAVLAGTVCTMFGVARPARASVAVRLAWLAVPFGAFIGVGTASGFAADELGGFDHVVGCLARGVGFALVPLLVLLIVWRRVDPYTPRLTGGVLGAVAGLAGAVATCVACPHTTLIHVAIAHVGTIAAGVVLGSLGSRWLRP
jgi:hypothetical protein